MSKEDSLNINSLLNVDEERVKEIFSNDYQNKFIKLFIEDEEFHEQVFDIVFPEYFSNYQKILVDSVVDYVNKYHGRPDSEDLKTHIRKKEKNESGLFSATPRPLRDTRCLRPSSPPRPT